MGDNFGGGSGGDAGDTGDDSSGILGFLKDMLKDIRSDLQALGSGITSLVNGIGEIIQNSLKAVFVPSDGFLDEKLTSLKTTVGAKFGLSSMGEIDSWLTDMDAYKPNGQVQMGDKFVNMLSMRAWDNGHDTGLSTTPGFYMQRLHDFMRVFLYPILLFGNWKYMVWIIRGSHGAGEE